MVSLDFLLISLVVALLPGTGVVVALGAGLSGGARASLVAALGCALGIVPHMLAAITGLAALLHSSALVFEGIKYAGVAYLLYIAFATLKDDGPLQLKTAGQARSNWHVIWSAMLVNALNPKLSMFFLAFLPQFIAADNQQQTIRMVQLSAVFMVISFVVFAVYGLAAAAIRDRVLSSPRALVWLRRGFACSFIALGVKLVLTKR